ncbi:MAG: hypothetical protein Q8L90_07465 [Bacteroidota bacterium]|nr:hypothetical protein [Bacteroidota bacterium]
MNASKNTCVILFLAIFMISGCSDLQSGDKSLKDKQKADEIMTSISSDSAMTEEMLDHLILSENANQQIKIRMKSIMTKDFLMELMKDDSVLTNEVMCSVMEMAGKDQMVCKQIKQTIEQYDLEEKIGIEWIDKTLVEKDKVQVQIPLKIPAQKTNAN